MNEQVYSKQKKKRLFECYCLSSNRALQVSGIRVDPIKIEAVVN